MSINIQHGNVWRILLGILLILYGISLVTTIGISGVLLGLLAIVTGICALFGI